MQRSAEGRAGSSGGGGEAEAREREAARLSQHSLWGREHCSPSINTPGCSILISCNGDARSGGERVAKGGGGGGGGGRVEECRCIRRGVSRLAPLLNTRSPALLFHLVHACHDASPFESPKWKWISKRFTKIDSTFPPSFAFLSKRKPRKKETDLLYVFPRSLARSRRRNLKMFEIVWECLKCPFPRLSSRKHVPLIYHLKQGSFDIVWECLTKFEQARIDRLRFVSLEHVRGDRFSMNFRWKKKRKNTFELPFKRSSLERFLAARELSVTNRERNEGIGNITASVYARDGNWQTMSGNNTRFHLFCIDGTCLEKLVGNLDPYQPNSLPRFSPPVPVFLSLLLLLLKHRITRILNLRFQKFSPSFDSWDW